MAEQTCNELHRAAAAELQTTLEKTFDNERARGVALRELCIRHKVCFTKDLIFEYEDRHLAEEKGANDDKVEPLGLPSLCDEEVATVSLAEQHWSVPPRTEQKPGEEDFVLVGTLAVPAQQERPAAVVPHVVARGGAVGETAETATSTGAYPFKWTTRDKLTMAIKEAALYQLSLYGISTYLPRPDAGRVECISKDDIGNLLKPMLAGKTPQATASASSAEATPQQALVCNAIYDRAVEAIMTQNCVHKTWPAGGSCFGPVATETSRAKPY